MADNLASITIENNVSFKLLEDGRTEICMIADKSFRYQLYVIREILKNAVTYVKSGGTLIYSTCTIAKEENDLQVDWILENLPLQLVSLEGCVCEELLKDCKREGVLQLLPGREKTDGFFLAKFQKR